MLNKRLLLSVATVVCALGIGYAMQPKDPGRPGIAAPGGGTVESSDAAPQMPQELDLALTNISLTSALPQRSGVPQPATPSITSRAEVQIGCDMAAQAQARPGALVLLQVTAPCLRGERVTIHHQGVMFTETLDDLGALDVVVPALARSAVFIVDARSGDAEDRAGGAVVLGGALAVVDVPDLDQVSRVVMQWQGDSGFEIHAREFGAQYGEAGHVWHQASEAGAGQVLRLGDPNQIAARLVEAYSFALVDPAVAGEIEISIEAEITTLNCGREQTAQSLHLNEGRLTSRDLVLEIPDCSAAGDFLVLNNLVENLKIAAK